MEIASLLMTNLLASLSLFCGLWLVAQKTRDPSFVDAFWAFGILLMAVLSFVQGEAFHQRRLILTGLCVLWGLRLGLHLFLRWRQEGADKRYERLVQSVKDKRGWSFAKTSALFIFLPQAILLWVTALPVQLGQATGPEVPLGVLAMTGLSLAVFGLIFEALADEQLRRFKAQPENADKVLQTGLWAWSRHPNYFGETVFWWGLYLIAAETMTGAASILGPVFVTFTLTRWSGIPLMENSIGEHRPGFADYKSRTSAFIPLPPKRKS